MRSSSQTQQSPDVPDSHQRQRQLSHASPTLNRQSSPDASQDSLRPAQIPHSPKVGNVDDIWGPFQQFGFDSHQLRFADSNILRTPDGTFFKYEKVSAIPEQNSLSLNPTFTNPYHAVNEQNASGYPAPLPYARQTSHEDRYAPPNRPSQDLSNGYSTFVHQATDGRPFSRRRVASPRGQGAGRQANSPPPDAYSHSPHSMSNPYASHDALYILSDRDTNTGVENGSSNQLPDRSRRQLYGVAKEDRVRKFSRSRPVETHDSGYQYPAGEDVNSVERPWHYTENEQGGASLDYMGGNTPAKLGPAASSPVPSDPVPALKHHSQRRPTALESNYTVGRGRGGLWQTSPTSMVAQSEYFASGPVTSTQMINHPPSASDKLRTSDDLAVNAPIYAGSDTASSTSDRTSNDTVTPGEVLVYEGKVERSIAFRSPPQPALLKVFRHTITKDLRIYSRITTNNGNDTESFKMRECDVELVPTYAFNAEKGNVTYLREITHNFPGASPSNSSVYQFSNLSDLVDFQGKLLEEDVQLDVSSLRYAILTKCKGSDRRIDSARLQLWHEQTHRSRRNDAGSIMTAGTSLSGPLRERTSPDISRLVLFLGRAGEFLSLFVTDDIEISQKGTTGLFLRARKYKGRDYLKSRSGVKCHLVSPNNATANAGIPLSKRKMDPEDEESYAEFKSLQFEFENEISLTSFWETWDTLLRLRRGQRMRIQGIQSDMSRRVYYGCAATKLL